MVDIVSTKKRSEMMSGIKNRNTRPEIIVRSLLHKGGFRFRLHDKRYPGKPDILLPKWQKAVFVNGCFWHGHHDCPIFRLPKSNTEFWRKKIDGNKARDFAKEEQLRALGFGVIIVWECALRGKLALESGILTTKLFDAVRSPQITRAEIAANRPDKM